VKHSKPKLIPTAGYQVRVSPRAKHVSIRVSHLGEVEVVVPKGFDQRKIPEMVRQRQDWIAKTIQRIEAERLSLEPDSMGTLPQKIPLRSISEEWGVLYRPTAEPQVRLILAIAHQLIMHGAVENIEGCRHLLQRWLTRKAKSHLEPWLRQVSEEIDLPFDVVSVRGQKTRWASCSSDRSISLNYKLLFLPPPLVRYVFIHELCHTIHLNHSSRFWDLVEEKEPNYRELDKELRKAWRYVPEWVERDKP
jgi:predicted metal-dependent hydrolase